jgi:hypothetical protein
MAITTYAELQTALANWLNRSDLTSRIPEFIALAEADMNRQLRTQDQITSLSATAATASVTLPTDFLEALYVTLGDDDIGGDIRQSDLTGNKIVYDATSAGPPKNYAIAGSTLYFSRWSESMTYGLIYYAKIPALTDSNTTNWLLTKAPDAYLYGALTHASPYLMDDDRAAMWATAYGNAIDGLNKASERARFGGGPLNRRVRTFG